MVISKKTIEIWKNFFTINQSLLVKPGNKLSTISVARNVIATAEVNEEFPREFAIYNLNEFLSAVSLFEHPDLEFRDKYVIIREEGATRGGLKYFYANKSLITYPTKELKIPDDIAVNFTLEEPNLLRMYKAAAVLGVNDVVVVGDEEGISVVVCDRKNDSSNDLEIPVSNEPQSEPFEFHFKYENLKMLPGTYQVRISPRGIGIFTSQDGSLEYAVALEAK